jgi:hypothetical protein
MKVLLTCHKGYIGALAGPLLRSAGHDVIEMQASRKKVRFIMDTFHSQRNKHWFEATTFFSLMWLRGIDCRAAGGHAEAFYCRKLVL